MASEVDIVIVGAGAAGLAAAARLASAPVSVLVLEARDRVGGRAHSLQAGGFGLDLGCGWLHSAEQNPFVKVAERLGFEIDRSPPHWTRQAGNQDFSVADQAAFRDALEAFEERVSQAAQAGRDIAASQLFEAGSRWNPLLDAFSSFYNGAEFDQISTVDYDAYDDGMVNWRLSAGYGALITAFGAPAPVRLETPVTRIAHGGPRVHIGTPGGDLSARAVIVTIPTDLLAGGAISFDPGLPRVLAAAAALPLGLANKVFFSLDDIGDFGPDSHLFGSPLRTETGSYSVRPMGRPMIETYLGGRNARELEREGPGAATAFAIEELAALLGSGFRKKITPIAETRWASDPWSRGSYSHALPGEAAARAVLATPVDDRLFFAGEATSPTAFSTAHGAAQSGAAAADAALAAVSGRKLEPDRAMDVLSCMDDHKHRAHQAWRTAERVKRLSDRLVGVGPIGIGLDGVLAWIPGVGAFYSLAAGAVLMAMGFHAKAGPGALAKMAAFIAADTATDAVPVLGWAADTLFPGHLMAAKALQKDIEARHGLPVEVAALRGKKRVVKRRLRVPLKA